MEEKGFVFNIQHGCDHDGPGIRTSIFLKGCSLQCRWCHNPESWSRYPSILFNANKCIGCGQCVPVCPQGCHSIQSGIHSFDRKNCIACGKCTSVCPGALEPCGQEMSSEEVVRIALEDQIFYESTNGGITVSGGEPLEQPEFTRAILATAKEHGIHTCLETSAYAPVSALISVLPYVDLLLLDYKLSSAADYMKWTASDGMQIKENQQLLADMDVPIWLRCPYVPGVHGQAHLTAIAEFANSVKSIQKIQLMPYHNLGVGKYLSMGLPIPEDKFCVPDKDQVSVAIAHIQSKTKITVTRG